MSDDPLPPNALTEIVDDVVQTAKEVEDDAVDLDTLVSVAGGRGGLVPIMTLVALTIVSPLSGIPGLSSICGFTIALCAGQAALGRRTLWLPKRLARSSISPKRVIWAMERVRRAAQWLEDHATRRLEFLSAPPLSTLFLASAALFGLSMPMLEFIPFSSSLIGLSVVLIGLGLLLRDGLLLLAALVPPIGVGFLIVSVLSA